MIISWFTQPPKSFSSYCQYDTVTQELSRVRLELGRNSSSGRTNDTMAIYNSKRVFGFSKSRLAFDSKNPGEHWSVEDGELCYDGKPLRDGRPEVGDWVYDTSDPYSFVHFGNPVTAKPVLPADIKPEHLALLANDALIKEDYIRLTGGGASGTQLSDAIKGEVCRILDVPVEDFADITNGAILTKLTSQAQSISDAVSSGRSNLEQALTAAKKANAVINEQISEGRLTPTSEFEEAFGSLQSALTNAQTATKNEADVRQALIEIGNAQQALETAIKNIDATENEIVAKQLELASDSLNETENHVNEWQSVEEEYESLTEAQTVEEYMDSLSSEAEL
jgi:hypothetical protein